MLVPRACGTRATVPPADVPGDTPIDAPPATPEVHFTSVTSSASELVPGPLRHRGRCGAAERPRHADHGHRGEPELRRRPRGAVLLSRCRSPRRIGRDATADDARCARERDVSLHRRRAVELRAAGPGARERRRDVLRRHRDDVGDAARHAARQLPFATLNAADRRRHRDRREHGEHDDQPARGDRAREQPARARSDRVRSGARDRDDHARPHARPAADDPSDLVIDGNGVMLRVDQAWQTMPGLYGLSDLRRHGRDLRPRVQGHGLQLQARGRQLEQLRRSTTSPTAARSSSPAAR